MRRPGHLALLAALVPLAACDAVSLAPAAPPDPPAREGWESVEGGGAATRLYYQFVDESRRVRFVERLEDVPAPLRATVGFVELATPPPLTPGDAERARRSQTASAAPAPASSRVVLYSASWCGACRKAKRHLERRGVAFAERDVDLPAIEQELLRRTGARSIPVLEVDGRVFRGFDARAYDALVGRG